MSIRVSIRACTALALLLTISAAALAQRPLIYPGRSQTPAQQTIDNALCYSEANSQTRIDIARQPQTPVRPAPIKFAADSGRGAHAPPLPPGMPASSTHPASGTTTINVGSSVASGAPAVVASNAGGASGVTAPAALSGMTSTLGLANASSVPIPPLPPPEPPMVTYWRAFGDCMQKRGYIVR
jgi:hypothetical protein